MGRPKDEYFWNKISIEEDGKLKCKQCGLKFKGGVSRIKAHIAGKGGQGIRLCSTPPKDITSSNLSHKHTNVITTAQGERAGEMTDIIVGDSINYERIINSTWLGGERVGEMTTFVGDSIDHEIVIGSKSLGGERAREITVIDGDSINHERVIGSTSLAGERTGELTAIGDDSINHERVLGSTSLGVSERAREIIDIVGGSIEQERDIGSTSLRDFEAEYGDGVLTTLQSSLEEFISDLTSEKEDIQRELQWLESHGKKRKRDIDDWLDKLQDMQQKVIDTKNSLNQFGCTNFYASKGKMYLNEEILQLTQEMQEHRERKPLVLSNEFIGRKFEENVKTIWKLLRDDQVFNIGIYGMGGVGKTFIAAYMQSEINRKKAFKDILWVTVSNDFTIFKLQQQIAEKIKVKLFGDDEKNRAITLTSELEKREKMILILDDVWKYIDLEKVGIPLRVNGIKLIITSRLRHVLQQMDCLPFRIIIVTPFYCYNYDDFSVNFNYDDWELFLLKLGYSGIPSTLSYQVHSIARSVVRRCDGLPLGISVMARTMKGKTNIHWWKHALNKLDKLEMGVEMNEEVLSVLRSSYDNLTEKNLQKCFLYGALLPNFFKRNDFIRKLVDWRLLDGNISLEEIFHEGNVIIDKLMDHSLFLEHNYLELRIQGLMKKLAWNILKEKGNNMMVKCNENMEKIPHMEEWTIDLEVVSLPKNEIKEIPEGTSPSCPRLSTLLLFDNSIRDIPECFFIHMKALTTLDLSKNSTLTHLPHSLSNLRSLTSLMLNECSKLEYIPPLGGLQSLLRLEISGCPIQVLPEGLEKLINLKWLDLSNHFNLELVPGNFLSSLTNIQYLDLYGCSGIKVEDVKRMTMLECFAGTFVDRDNFNRYMQETLGNSYGPQTYFIYYKDGNHKGHVELSRYRQPLSQFKCRSMCINECEQLSYVLPRNLQNLFIQDNSQWVCLCAALSSNGPFRLEKIHVLLCTKLKNLFCLSCSLCSNIHSLQSLWLCQLESLTAIFKEDIANLIQASPPINRFSQLKLLYISECHTIKTLLTLSLVSQLQNLEIIDVLDCNLMEQIFAVADHDDSIKITLPELTELYLKGLPQLKTVCKEILVCKSGFELQIYDCPNLYEPRIEYVAL